MTTTTEAAFIPEVWLPKVNEFYQANLQAGNFFMDLSEAWMEVGGDILHIPNTTALSANSKSVASQVTLQNPTDTTVDLTIDSWYEASFMLEDYVNAQVSKSYALKEMYAKSAAYAVSKQLDTALTNLFAGFSQSVGSSTATIADSNLRGAIEYLDLADAPEEGRAFFLYPTVAWDVAALDRFSLYQNSPKADPVMKGLLGWIYGIPVIKTTNLGVSAGSRLNALVHKDALAFATTGIRVQTNYIPEYLGWLTTADIQYGVIENRDTSGVWIKTASN